MYQMDIKEKITCISCGFCFCTVITDNGKIYSWNFDYYQAAKYKLQSTDDFLKKVEGKTIGNLFLFKTHSYRYKDVWIYRKFRMYMYMIRLVKVACGSHTLALTNKGKVYGWGLNCYKQSDPNKKEEGSVSPTMVNDVIIMTNRTT